jgi:hypothetical protein
MLNSHIVDGFGSGNRLRINGEGEMNVVVHPHPPTDEAILTKPYRSRFATAAGATTMVVDGSSTNVEFTISSDTDFDTYVKVISVIIGDGGTPTLNKFGALTALTNGVEISFSTQDIGSSIIHDGIKTNLEFIRLGSLTGAIGTGADAYLADVAGGGSEKSYLPTIDLAQTFGLQYGIRLRKSSTDKIIIKIRDDLTALTTMDAIAYGINF